MPSLFNVKENKITVFLSIILVILIVFIVVLLTQRNQSLNSSITTQRLINDEWFKIQFPVPYNSGVGMYNLQCVTDELYYTDLKLSNKVSAHAFVSCYYLNAQQKEVKVFVPVALNIIENEVSNWRFFGGEDGDTLYEDATIPEVGLASFVKAHIPNQNSRIIIRLPDARRYQAMYGLEHLFELFLEAYTSEQLDSFGLTGDPSTISKHQVKDTPVVITNGILLLE